MMTTNYKELEARVKYLEMIEIKRVPWWWTLIAFIVGFLFCIALFF